MTFLTDLTKNISNSTICDWYFYMYLINASVFVIFFIWYILGMLFNSKFRKLFGLSLTIQLVIMSITLVSSLFFYTMLCDRVVYKNASVVLKTE